MDKKDEDGWWMARKADGTSGLIPSTYVSSLMQASQIVQNIDTIEVVSALSGNNKNNLLENKFVRAKASYECTFIFGISFFEESLKWKGK